MIDNGDGTYTLDYTLSQPGTVNVSFEHYGLFAKYFDNDSTNPSNLNGVPNYTAIESEINHYWGIGAVNPLTG